ncbi:hypothetical protein RYA05_05030 [Pseudomonas syringae pv. actinidiae]|nr:hypothetical protein [Pseudomonas syringae pv. actinidiae]
MITLLLSILMTFLTSWGLGGLGRLLFSLGYSYDLDSLINLSFSFQDLAEHRLPMFLVSFAVIAYFTYLRGSNVLVSEVKPA